MCYMYVVRVGVRCSCTNWSVFSVCSEGSQSRTRSCTKGCLNEETTQTLSCEGKIMHVLQTHMKYFLRKIFNCI